MKTARPLVPFFKTVQLSILALLGGFSFITAKPSPTTVAFSEISPHYKREMLPSGHYRPETYAFSEGNLIDHSGKDTSLRKLNFGEIGGLLAKALLEADYVPTQNLIDTQLLIVVSWGKTTLAITGMGDLEVDNVADAMNDLVELEKMGGPDGTSLQAEYENKLEDMIAMQEMAQEARNRANADNATLLGYDQALRQAAEMANSFAPMLSHRDELLSELESPRYFVVLQVYDFQTLWKEKKRELLWTSRFSIRAKGHQFDEELLAMAMASCAEFGQASKSLQRNSSDARVELGELEYLGVVEEE